MPKTIAIYLPQFHEVEENNQWWGKGFTDWMTVKGAESLYEGHRQPRVPMNQNYYDLMEHDTMRWQAELAQKYKVSGFCFYHYWFKDGRRVLEKPAENLLKWTDIDMPFCFSWANQTWARTWTKIQNSNAWTGANYEKAEAGDGILLKQSYGGKKEWKEHFEYLLPFFKDSRYIRHGGKPVFLIYKPEYMYCLDNMMEYWKELALENGLEGICVVTVRSNCKKWSQADYWLMQEFDYSFMPGDKVYGNGVWTIPYKDAWENVLVRAYRESDENAFLGGFTDCDDTPRRGNRGVAIRDASPEVFKKYFEKIAELAVIRKSEFIFVNAWNEWGEGAYMEPDEEFGYGYLEAVKNVMESINQRQESQIALDAQYMMTEHGKNLGGTVSRERYAKISNYYHLLDKWVTNRENDKKIEHVLSGMDIKRIAIYGMGDLGRHLYKELEHSSITVELCFDKNAEFLCLEDPRDYIEKEYHFIDAVIVTPILEYGKIRSFLKPFFGGLIISLEELIAECEMS